MRLTDMPGSPAMASSVSARRVSPSGEPPATALCGGMAAGMKRISPSRRSARVPRRQHVAQMRRVEAAAVNADPSHIPCLPCGLLILFFLLLAAALDRGGDRLVVEVLLALLALLLGRLLAGTQAGLDRVVVAGGLLLAGFLAAAFFFSCASFSDLRQITNFVPTQAMPSAPSASQSMSDASRAVSPAVSRTRPLTSSWLSSRMTASSRRVWEMPLLPTIRVTSSGLACARSWRVLYLSSCSNSS